MLNARSSNRQLIQSTYELQYLEPGWLKYVN